MNSNGKWLTDKDKNCKTCHNEYKGICTCFLSGLLGKVVVGNIVCSCDQYEPIRGDKSNTKYGKSID